MRFLGPKRRSQTEHRQYLMEIALELQRTVSLAVNSDYSRSSILSGNKEYRIATEAVKRGQRFADAMACHGHTYSFLVDDDESDEDFGREYTEEDKLDISTTKDHPDIEDLVHKNRRVTVTSDQDTLSWLKDEYRSSRGFELGTFDASLLAINMKQQAINWCDLALGYVSDIISLVHSFILGVLQQIAPSARVFEGVKSCVTDDIACMYGVAMSQTKFLCPLSSMEHQQRTSTTSMKPWRSGT